MKQEKIMSRKVIKENSKLNDKLHLIEEFMEKNNLRLIPTLIKDGKYQTKLLLTNGDRYFIFISSKGKEINEFPPREIGRYYLCDKFGNCL